VLKDLFCIEWRVVDDDGAAIANLEINTMMPSLLAAASTPGLPLRLSTRLSRYNRRAGVLARAQNGRTMPPSGSRAQSGQGPHQLQMRPSLRRRRFSSSAIACSVSESVAGRQTRANASRSMLAPHRELASVLGLAVRQLMNLVSRSKISRSFGPPSRSIPPGLRIDRGVPPADAPQRVSSDQSGEGR
jgi:hypothetical protein